jgi:hypothetical protein
MLLGWARACLPNAEHLVSASKENMPLSQEVQPAHGVDMVGYIVSELVWDMERLASDSHLCMFQRYSGCLHPSVT